MFGRNLVLWLFIVLCTISVSAQTYTIGPGSRVYFEGAGCTNFYVNGVRYNNLIDAINAMSYPITNISGGTGGSTNFVGVGPIVYIHQSGSATWTNTFDGSITYNASGSTNMNAGELRSGTILTGRYGAEVVLTNNTVFINTITNVVNYGVSGSLIQNQVNGNVYLKPLIATNSAVVYDDGTTLSIGTPISFWTNVVGGTEFTGITGENNIYTITIPANAIGQKGRIFFTAMWKRTGGTGNGNYYVRYGGGGALSAQFVITTGTSSSAGAIPLMKELWAMNSFTNLVGMQASDARYWETDSTLPIVLTNDTRNGVPVYINLLPNASTETNLFIGAHLEVWK